MGGAIMIVGGIVALVYGVDAEGQSLEDVATPLNAGRRGTTRAEGAGSPRATVSRPGVAGKPRSGSDVAGTWLSTSG